jgi:signal transduction histidine kinase/class 3 adenylate cyclase
MKAPDAVLTRTLVLVGLIAVLVVAGLWAAASEGARATIPALAWLGGGVALAATVVLVVWQARRIVQLNRQLREAKTAAVQGTFGHYLDPQVVEHLVESANLVDSLGVEERVMTVFFSDVADFTTMCEHLSPTALAALLNQYFTVMGEVIGQHGGTIDKFIGDAILALYGAPMPCEDHAERAVLACIDMQEKIAELRQGWKEQKELRELQQRWAEEGRGEFFRVRMGVNTGSMGVGNMGSKTRINYTVMGEAVNFAARLEGTGKVYGVSTMISHHTYERVQGVIEARLLDTIRPVQGEPVKVYEVLGRKGQVAPDRAEAARLFTRGYEMYTQRHWDEAITSFEAALRAYPDDGPSERFIRRCQTFKLYPPPADWKAVHTLGEVRRGNADRVRAEIATMRTSADLERVMPLIWQELTEQGVPFVRCGVCVANETEERVSVYLTNLRGISLVALNLAFASHPRISTMVEHWWAAAVYTERWDKQTFLDYQQFLQEHGQVSQRKGSLDIESLPEFLILQCVPFVQGMLYVLSAAPVPQQDVALMKDLAHTFSVAYARYLDFQRVEQQNLALSAANQQIQEATARKSAFLASMSHELRTPMNAIIGFTNLVLRRSGDVLPERQRDNLTKVLQSAHHLLNLINDILDLSKIEAGRMEVKPAKFEVKKLLMTCCETMSSLVKPGVQLLYEISDEVGEATTDEARLRQIIINLLSNALKFTEAGEVRLRAVQEGAYLVVAVADTGTGIPAAALDSIFEEFWQVEGSDKQHQGTGLGLPITKGWTKLLGGTIEVESEVGQGSTFTIRMPVTYKEG